MAEYVQTLRLGAATVTVINIGYFNNTVAEPSEPMDAEALPRLPVQCMVIQLPETILLVDASLYDVAPDSPFFIPGYQPPPSLLARLDEIGVKPEQVAHLIITHAHFDHFNGVTVEHEGKYQPCFPNARHYLGRADWENPDMQTALQDSDSLASHTLAILQQAGLLELVTGNRRLNEVIQIIAAPGESPGHQMVQLASEGEILYFLGDLYHGTDEVEQPEHMAWWVDPATMNTSRQALVEAALAENALLTAAHIPTIGRLRRTDSGLTWQAV